MTPRSPGRTVLVVVSVAVGVPALLAAWIGLLFLAEGAGLSMTANEVFAWLLATLVALVLWPLSLRTTYRLFGSERQRRLGEPRPPRGAPLSPAPSTAPGDRLGRIAVVALGAIALVLICGSQQVTALLTQGIGAASSGPRSAWLLLQLAVFVLLFALFLPVLGLTDRALRHVALADPRRQVLEARQHWYLAAVTAWVTCLVLGYLLAYLVLTRL